MGSARRKWLIYTDDLAGGQVEHGESIHDGHRPSTDRLPVFYDRYALPPHDGHHVITMKNSWRAALPKPNLRRLCNLQKLAFGNR